MFDALSGRVGAGKTMFQGERRRTGQEVGEKVGLASKWLRAWGSCVGFDEVEFLPFSHRRTSSSSVPFSFRQPPPHNTVTMENERGDLVDLYDSPMIP
jgi:hypothetical protein